MVNNLSWLKFRAYNYKNTLKALIDIKLISTTWFIPPIWIDASTWTDYYEYLYFAEVGSTHILL